jgi:hypothetical protein
MTQADSNGSTRRSSSEGPAAKISAWAAAIATVSGIAFGIAQCGGPSAGITPSNDPLPSGSATPQAAAPLPVFQWTERWTDPIQVSFTNGIDFDYQPPPGRSGFGTDLETSRDGTDLLTEGTGKLLAWTDQSVPSPQQCYELTANSPATQDSQYINRPEVGRSYCLLTWNGKDPGRVVVFTVTDAIQLGFNLNATVWNRK